MYLGYTIYLFRITKFRMYECLCVHGFHISSSYIFVLDVWVWGMKLMCMYFWHSIYLFRRTKFRIYECLHVHENLDEYLCEVNISFRMDDPPERYYPGLDLVYDKVHRARLIERGDMDLVDNVRQILFSNFFVAIINIVTTTSFFFRSLSFLCA